MAAVTPLPPALSRRMPDDAPQTLNESLRRSAARRPDHPAIIYYGAEITYGALLRRVERLAAHLQHAAKLARGDRVLLDMQNSPHFAIAYYAVLRAGGVVVPVNPMSMPDELAYLVEDSGARVALIGVELVDRFSALAPAVLAHVVVAAYGDELPGEPVFPPPAVVSENRGVGHLPDGFIAWADALAETRAPLADDATPGDLCVMPYTSGTTGRPKACMHPHSNVVFTAVAQAVWYDFVDTTVITAFMPLFHVAGMQFSLNGGISAGVTMAMMARWDRALIPPLFKRYRVTHWSAAPTMVVDVLTAPDGFDDETFAHLRLITGGGSTMPAAVAESLERRFNLRFVEGYGLSESISATHINPPEKPKPQCLGVPIYETESRVIDPETLAELPPGEIGEIIIAGPQIMRGYWRRPEASAEAFIDRDGKRFLRTGDLGRVDEDGYYYTVDRLKRMINVSGYKVWPAECEANLYRHPAIRECCVIAAPDDYRGETVKALVVLKDGASLSAEELIEWSRTIMAAYKAPRIVEFVKSLPRSGSNKIDWRKLQEAERARYDQARAGTPA